ARLEPRLPALGEAGALVAGHRLGGGSGAQDRDDCLVHAGMVSQTCAGLAGLAGRASLGSALTTVAPSLKPTAARSGQCQAGAVGPLLDAPFCLREVLGVCLGPAEYVQAVLKLVEGEALGRVRVQLAVFEVARQERPDDRRVQAVVGDPQEVFHRVAGG